MCVSWRQRHDERFGRLKLAKTLFCAAFDSYADDGQVVTGARYEHYETGHSRWPSVASVLGGRVRDEVSVTDYSAFEDGGADDVTAVAQDCAHAVSVGAVNS